MTQRNGWGRIATWWEHWTHPVVISDPRMVAELQAIADHQAALQDHAPAR
jgi:hypothetical protein